jgi:Na+:H+ antiporter, NhaA family
MVGAGILAGIGFTVSLFIAELAFGGGGDTLARAKLGVLAASVVAGVLGYLWLRLALRSAAQR